MASHFGGTLRVTLVLCEVTFQRYVALWCYLTLHFIVILRYALSLRLFTVPSAVT